MEQIQNNRVITDLYRENAQFPGIALDGSDVYLCWQRFVDRHDSLMASCRRGDASLHASGCKAVSCRCRALSMA